LDLTPEEQHLIEGAINKPLVGFPAFTNYFCQAQDTGSWFSGTDDHYFLDNLTSYRGAKITMYEYLLEEWKDQQQPSEFWAQPPYHSKYWLSKIRYDVEFVEGLPAFHWAHGWIPLEWGAQMHYASQTEHCVLGGFGAAKTAQVGMSAFTWAVAVPRFRFVCVAAFLSNAKPMFQEICNAVLDTKAEQFIAKNRNGDLQVKEYPFPTITMKNGSRMVWIGADKDIQKVRSESGDWYCVEQSESHSDLGRVTLELGSRARGTVRGRRRLGRFTFVANSGEAPELWERFALAEEKPETYWSYNLTTYDNPHLSRKDVEMLERACGDDPDQINQYMRGLKPVGTFKDFPKSAIERCENTDLDSVMQARLRESPVQVEFRNVPGIGPVKWGLPYQEGHDYAVYGDPGTKNPPARGAGVTLVLDETHFPQKPATLVYFAWVPGDNQIGPWIDDFEHAIQTYRANGRAYYDATGDQKMIDELTFQDRNLLVMGVGMAGQKHGMRLKLLRLMERGLIQWPKGISGIRMQFAKYDAQVDKESTHLPQDIVMAFHIAAQMLGMSLSDAPDIPKSIASRKMIRTQGGIRRHRTIVRRPR